MGEIFLVRHGQASFGSDDYDRLSVLGHAQAGWLGDWFAGHDIAFDRVISGTLRRHVETAEVICDRLGRAIDTRDERLNELDYWGLERAFCERTGTPPISSSADFARLMPEILENWAKGSLGPVDESHGAFADRIAAGIDAAATPGAKVLVVSSGGPVSMTVARALDLDHRATAQIMLMTHNASVTRFRLEDDRLWLSQFNAIPHLEAPARAHARTFI